MSGEDKKCYRSLQKDDLRMDKNSQGKLCGKDREGRELTTYLALPFITSHSKSCSTPCPGQVHQ